MATDALPFSSPIEMRGWEARHFTVHNASSAPTAYAREGQMYWDTVEKQLKIDTANGANWANLLRQGRDYTINDAWTIAQTWDFTSNFTITDTTKITNLNADMVDGLHTSVTAVNNTIIARDGNGRAQINDPVADKDIVNKLYVDSSIAGRAFEIPAMVAIETNINISSPSTATYDGITLLNGDRILLIGQTNPVQNGLYVWNGVGAALSRPSDSDSPNSNAIETSSNINIANPGTSTFGGVVASPGDIVFLRAQTDTSENGPYTFNGSGSAMTSYTIFADLIPGSGVFIKKGTEYGGAQFNVSSPQAKKAISIDVDQQVWTQTNAQNVYSADGFGLELVGTQFRLEVDGVTLEKTADHLHIHPNYGGQASITTLGTVATGTWQANTIGANYGGTGQNSYSQGDLLYYNGTTSQLARLSLGGIFQILMSDGVRPQWLGLTPGLIDATGFAEGAVIFSNGAFFDVDETQFIYDDANNRLGLGTSTPQTKLHLKDAAPTIRFEQTGGNAGFGQITAGTSYGDLIYTANAGGAGGSATHTWKHSTSTIAQMSSQGYLNLGGSARSFTAGLDVAAPSTSVPTAIFSLRDNLAGGFQIKQGSDYYFLVDTNDGAEKIVFGNAGTNPYYHFKGDGSTTIGDDPTIGIQDITDKLHVEGTMFSDTIQSQRIGRQGGFHFDGSNDYVEFDKIDFGLGDFTLCFDLEHDDVPSGTEIISRVASGNNRWALNASATNYTFQIVNGAGVTSTYTFSVAPKTGRQSLIISADRNGLATLYINGRLIATADISGTSSVNMGSGNTVPITLGASAASFDGKIYEARFYSSLKTHTEVINIAQGYNDRNNLELHFAESSTEPWGWRDISGNARHGVNVGASRIESPISTSFTSHSEFIQWKPIDGGYRFNGSSSSIETGLSLFAGKANSGAATVACSSSASTGTIFGSYATSGAGLMIRWNTSNRVVLFLNDGSSTVFNDEIVSPILTTETTYVITWVLKSGDNRFYINGILVWKSTATWSDFTPSDSAVIGARNSGANDRLNGYIRELRLFNKALSASEVFNYSKGDVTSFSDRNTTSGGLLASSISTLDSGWVASGTASISSGTATFDGSGGAVVYDGGVPKIGKRYRVTVTVGAFTSGSLRVILGDSGTLHELNVNGSGVFTLEAVSNGTNDNLNIYGYGGTGNFNGTVTDVQIEEIGESARYTPESATSLLWEDVSGNEKHAVNNGATVSKPSIQTPYILEQKLVESMIGSGPGYSLRLSGTSISGGVGFKPGLRDFSVMLDLNIKTITQTGYLFYSQSSGANRFVIGISASGIYFLIYDNESASTAITVPVPTIPGRKRIACVFDRDSDLRVYINGKKIGEAPFSSFSGIDFGSSNSNNYIINSSSFGVDAELFGLMYYNRAVTNDEVSLISDGQYIGFSDYGANGSALYTSDFSVDANGFVNSSNATVSGNIDAVSSEDNTLSITSNTSSGGHSAHKPGVFTYGKRYAVTFRYFIPSGQSNTDGIRFDVGSQVIGTLSTVGSWATARYEFVNLATSNPDRFWIHMLDGGSASFTDSGGDDKIHIKDVDVTQLGLVLDINGWGMAPGKCSDQSGNGYNGTVTGAPLINPTEHLYTKWIIDKNGSIGGDGQVLSKSSDGLVWINVTAAGGAGDIDGAGNGLNNWMTKWTDTNTITRSTLLYDNGTTIGIGYSGDSPTLPAGAKFAVSGVVHGDSYLWRTTTTHGLKFGTGYTELTNASGGVRLSSLNFRPNQANTNLGDTTNPWGSAVFSGRLASYQNLGASKIILTSIDTAQTGRTNSASESGAMFDLVTQTVSVGSGVGPSVKLQPYRDEDNNNTLTAGAAWEYFPSDNAWGASKLKIGSVIIDSTTQRPGRLVEHAFTVTGHGAGAPSPVTTTITHNLNNDTVVVGVNRRNNGSGVTEVVNLVPWEPNSADPNNKIDVTVGSQAADTYYKIIICG